MCEDREALYEKEDDLCRAAEMIREAAEISRAHMSDASEELMWIADVMEGEVGTIRAGRDLWPA